MSDNDIPVSAVVSLIDRVTAPIDRIMKTVDRIQAPVKRVNQAMSRLTTAAGFPKIMTGFRGVGSAVGRLGSQVGNLLGPIAALGGGLSLAGLGKTISDFAEYGGHIDDVSNRLGVSAKAFQEWTYWAKLGGVEQDALESSVGRLNRNLADLANGKNKELPVLFRKLGISVKDSNGHLRNAESLMPDLADAVQRIRDPIARTAVVTALFGKTGADLIPVLKDGSEGLGAAADEARKLGKVLDDDAIANAASFGDDMDRLSGAATGLGFSIASKLLPSLLPLIERLTQWIVANREIISSRIGAAIDKITGAVNRINWDGVLKGFQSLGNWIEKAVDFLGGWQNALIGVAAFMNGGLIAAITGVVGAIGALTAAIITNPVGAAITAIVYGIAGLAFVIYKNWDNIANWFQAKLDAVKTAFDQSFLGGILTVLDQFDPTRLFAEAINGLVNYLFGIDMFKIGSDWIDGLVKAVTGKISDLGSTIQNTLSGLLDFGGLFGGDQPAAAAPGVGTVAGGRGPLPPRIPLAAAQAAIQPAAPTGQVGITVDFRNVPQGAEIRSNARGNAISDMEVGRSRQGAL